MATKKLRKELVKFFGDEEQFIMFEDAVADISRNMSMFDFLGYADNFITPGFDTQKADMICKFYGLTANQMAQNIVSVASVLFHNNTDLDEFALEAEMNSKMRHWGVK